MTHIDIGESLTCSLDKVHIFVEFETIAMTTINFRPSPVWNVVSKGTTIVSSWPKSSTNMSNIIVRNSNTDSN